MYQILIVDDEPLAREYMRKMLPRFFPKGGLALYEAPDGIRAEELLQEKQIDMVITDIRMPGKNGMELAEIIHTKYPTIATMLISGYEEMEYAQGAIRNSVTDYLLKPIVLDDLKSAIARLRSTSDRRKEELKNRLSIQELSQNYHDLVTQNLIDATAHGENLKVRTYYELAHALHLPLIEDEGTVLRLRISPAQMLLAGEPIHNVSIYQLLLMERSAELLRGGAFSGWALPDRDGGTLICLLAENLSKLRKSVETFFKAISTDMKDAVGVSVYGGLGESVSDILQLDLSYRQAGGAMLRQVVEGDHQLYLREDADAPQISDFSRLVSGGPENCTASHSILHSYVSQLSEWNLSVAARCSVYLIEGLSALNREHYQSAYEQALHRLQEAISFGQEREWDLSAITELLYSLLPPFLGEEEEPETNVAYVINLAKRYIRAHYAEPLSLSLLADEAGVSDNYFSKLFHKEVGETYIRYLTRVRMDHALQMLREFPRAKIYEVSEAMGYNSVKHFNHIFKQWYGSPPNEYLKNNP